MDTCTSIKLPWSKWIIALLSSCTSIEFSLFLAFWAHPVFNRANGRCLGRGQRLQFIECAFDGGFGPSTKPNSRLYSIRKCSCYFEQNVRNTYFAFVNLTSVSISVRFASLSKSISLFKQIDLLIQANLLAHLSKSICLNKLIDTRRLDRPARPRPSQGPRSGRLLVSISLFEQIDLLK